jgi:hypothetical protein
MEVQTVKAHSSFLGLFCFQQLSKGSIIALEKTSCTRVHIVIKGEVACYKKLYTMESNDCEERTNEFKAICHN